MEHKTRIVFVDAAATLTDCYRKGESYDVAEPMASHFVRTGTAKLDMPEPAPVKGKGKRHAVDGNSSN